MSPQADDERLESLLRRTLRSVPPPRPAPGLSRRIADRARGLEHGRALRSSRSRRWILTAYWTVSALASAGIIASIPWPHWTPLALSDSAAWLFAAACAALLTPIEFFRRR